VKSVLDHIVRSSKVPGLQYLAVDRYGRFLEYAGGWADIARQRPMTTATTMMAYSMSKTITAAAVLQLVDSSVLKLDDAAATYLPNFPYAPEITIRQLIAHTSGIPNPVPLSWVHAAARHATFDENAALDAVLKKYRLLSFTPGTRFAYSNIGYWLLGGIVERAAKVSFTTFVRSQIIDRLGIPSSELDYTLDETNHAQGYLEKYSLLNLIKRFFVAPEFIGKYEDRWLQIKDHYLNGPAFGGLVGSGRGFAKFLQDQLNPHSKLFGDSTRDQFYIQQQTGKGPVAMTLGWHMGSLNGETFYYKEGGGGGFHCMMRLYPGRGVGTVLMTNATMFNVRSLMDRIDIQNSRAV